MADLDDLDPRARALLNAYRARTGPSPDVQARLRAAVLRDAEDMSERACPDAHVHELRPRARWAGPVVLAALAAAIVAALSLRHAEPQVADRSGAAAPWELAPSAPGSASRRTPATPRPAPATPTTDPPPAAPAVAPPAAPAPEPARPPAPARPTVRALPQEHAPKDIPEAPADGLAAEMEQMRPAQRALAEDRPADALAALASYAARFPAGLLREEHDALHAIALCAAGREREGRGEARVFLREHPTSMFAARLRTACGLGG